MKNIEKFSIQFSVIRRFCSHVDRISICMMETEQYENYNQITDVPESYNNYYLFGFGIIQSEFNDENGICFKACLEIVLTEQPRDFL